MPAAPTACGIATSARLGRVHLMTPGSCWWLAATCTGHVKLRLLPVLPLYRMSRSSLQEASACSSQNVAEVCLGFVQTLKYGALRNGETKVNLPVNMRRLLTNAKYATANSTAGAAVADMKPEKGEACAESCSCCALRSPAAGQCCHVRAAFLHCTACPCRIACRCFAAHQLNACPACRVGPAVYY